jgi:peptidoglycan/LPS O-acetylase OafA/YrhL
MEVPVSREVITARASAAVEYRPAIDGLRAVAVLAVFLFHLNHHWLPGGFVGVDVFFVISGYLITSIIFRDFERNSFSFGRFYQRRIARLLPTFFTAALVTIAAASFIYTSHDLASAGATLSAAAASIANFKFMFQGNYFILSPDAQPFLHCWSLSIEEQFYLLFPAIFLFVDWKAKKRRTALLLTLCAASLIFGIALTHFRPQWAFYLLPARAWELLAGSILASFKVCESTESGLRDFLPIAGLAFLALSFVVISENSAFPGYLASLPVLGTVCLLNPYNKPTGLAERILSWPPLVLIGRMSYSLYLWHWPIFSLVDYKLYATSTLHRLVLKILFSVVATTLCFYCIERPSRVFLNRPVNRRLTFAALLCSVVILIPLGMVIRNISYVSAEPQDVAKGGLQFNSSARSGSIVLMGDSDASMYAGMIKKLARERDLKLTVMSVDGGDPLPHSSGEKSPLWLDSLAIVNRQKPDVLILACMWTAKLADDPARLGLALKQLEPSARSIILLTQPPTLSSNESREGIRAGNRQPFIEAPAESALRATLNRLVASFQGKNVTVVNVDPLLINNEGVIRFVDDRGKLIYQDSYHLSDVGTTLVEPDLERNIPSQNPKRQK